MSGLPLAADSFAQSPMSRLGLSVRRPSSTKTLHQQEKRSRATERDVIELLAQLLREKKVETNKATTLAKMFIRIIDNKR